MDKAKIAASLEIIQISVEEIRAYLAAEPEEKPETVLIRGMVGRPKFEMVNRKNGGGQVAHWTAGLKIDVDGDGEFDAWIDVEAWRKTAKFASDNFESKSIVEGFGTWKTESWTSDNGEPKQREVFTFQRFVDEPEETK